MQKPLVVQSAFHPTTFLQRGVVVFLTTPILAGARVRENERSKLELVVPSISGARGSNVIPWSCLHEFCSATLHDREVQNRIAALPSVTPRIIRAVTGEVARSGHAGRKARAAAEASYAQDNEAQLLANYNLLLILIAQVEQRVPQLCDQSSPDIEQRAKRAIAHSAPKVGLDPDVVAQSLEQLASDFRSIGLGPTAGAASLPRTVARLESLRDAMAGLASADGSERSELAEAVRQTAELTLSCAPPLLARARALADNMIDLLARWQADSKSVTSVLTRPDWLLDGWEPICAIWETAEQSPAGRLAALREMMEQAPVLPKELGDWVDAEVTEQATRLSSRFVELNKDWRTGVTVHDLIARSEQRRALYA